MTLFNRERPTTWPAARDDRFSGLHALLRAHEERTFQDEAKDLREEVSAEAERGEGMAAAAA